MGVGNLDAEIDALAAELTFGHIDKPPCCLDLCSHNNYVILTDVLGKIKPEISAKDYFFPGASVVQYRQVFRGAGYARDSIAEQRDSGKIAVAALQIDSVEKRTTLRIRMEEEIMPSMPGIRLGTIIDNFHFEVLFGPEGYREREITTEDVNRPGMQLTGFFDYFDEKRIQMIGLVETSYLERLSSEERRHRFDMLLSYHVPALILARNLEPFPELLEMAEKHNRVLLRTKENTANIMSTLIAYLRMALSPSITRHGVLVEVYGEGVLLMGESGVGKSETAIELVKRGHRLIADDAVEIRRGLNNRLSGTAPELIRHYIELRGIGVVDVRRLFGMSAVKFDCTVDMLINLEVWKDDAIYDRLGADEFFTSILDVEIPTLTIPVKPGRNLAVIIEVAAMNNRNKKMGHNAALEFANQVDQHIQREAAAREQKQI